MTTVFAAVPGNHYFKLHIGDETYRKESKDYALLSSGELILMEPMTPVTMMVPEVDRESFRANLEYWRDE